MNGRCHDQIDIAIDPTEERKVSRDRSDTVIARVCDFDREDIVRTDQRRHIENECRVTAKMASHKSAVQIDFAHLVGRAETKK